MDDQFHPSQRKIMNHLGLTENDVNLIVTENGVDFCINYTGMIKLAKKFEIDKEVLSHD